MVLEIFSNLIRTIGDAALLLQTLGIVAAVIVIAQIVSFCLNTKRYRDLIKIKEDMKRIEDKIDKILKNN